MSKILSIIVILMIVGLLAGADRNTDWSKSIKDVELVLVWKTDLQEFIVIHKPVYGCSNVKVEGFNNTSKFTIITNFETQGLILKQYPNFIK